MKYSLLIPILLLSISGYAQTWPDKDCNDRPHIKGRSDTIYHTNNCGVLPPIVDTAHIVYKNDGFLTTNYHVSNPYIRIKLFYKGKKLASDECEAGFSVTSKPSNNMYVKHHIVTYDSLSVTLIYK